MEQRFERALKREVPNLDFNLFPSSIVNNVIFFGHLLVLQHMYIKTILDSAAFYSLYSQRVPNLVPRASFPLSSSRKTRALGASILK